MGTSRRNPIEDARLGLDEASEPPIRLRGNIPTRAELEARVAELNAKRSRSDLEWIIDAGGEIALVGCMEASKRRAAVLAEAEETRRREWMRLNGHMPTPPAPHWTDEKDDQ